MTAWQSTDSDDAVDLLVLGGGAAGMTAALVAALEGLRVVLCEKSSLLGGTAARSSGGIWIPGNGQTDGEGRGDALDDARRYADSVCGREDRQGLRAAYMAAARVAVDYLAERSEVRFVPLPHPDYKDLPGASTGGRSLGALPFDGRRLGADFDLIAPPLPALTALGGMMVNRADIPHLLKPWASVKSLAITARLVGRYCKDRLSHGRGTQLLMGNALVARLLLGLRQAGVRILLETTPVALIQEEGRIVGAELDGTSGRQCVRARRGVVIATGGFSHGSGWRERLMTRAEQAAVTLACEGATGDGLTLASGAGATVLRQGLSNAGVWTPISRLARSGRAPLLYPHLFLDRPKPGVVAVDQAGRRFVNEAASYHDFGARMVGDAARSGTQAVHLICDAEALERHGLGLAMPDGHRVRSLVRSGYLVRGESLEELAAKLGVNAAGLLETVGQVNQAAASGRDLSFGKGASSFDRFHGDAGHQPNPCIGPVRKAPFYAVKIEVADLATTVGISCDAHARALNAKSEPIAGLYACGNDMGSIWNGEAPGPGVTLGPALVFGYLAAMHAARPDLGESDLVADLAASSGVVAAAQL